MRCYLLSTTMISSKLHSTDRMPWLSRNLLAKFNHSSSSFLLSNAFINGEWIKPKSRKTFQVTNPANNKLVGQAAECDECEAIDAINAAQKAFEQWRNTNAKQRGLLLRKLYQLQMDNIDSLAELITLEMGKPIKESKGEIIYGASFLEWFAEETRRVRGEIFQVPFPNSMAMYVREPIGPVGIITPWNFPNAMITRKISAALAAGCTVVIRPAEDTPFSGLAIAKLAEEAGFPPGVINVIPSSRSKGSFIGKALCESPQLAAISFTGSTQVGKILSSRCASTIKKLCLELGGNAPFIVFDSANVNDAVQGCIASKFRNTGQTCVSTNVIYVHSSVFDQFVEKLQEEMKKQLKVGDPLDTNTTIGPLVNSRAVEKVKMHVEDAVSKGAAVITGGNVIEGNFFEPTILTNISSDMAMCREETFGPVASIYRFEREEEVIKNANRNRVGLAGYFYSNHHDQIWRVARALQVGMIGVNQGIISCCEAPFGGIKESGIGREGSHLGIEEFTNVKYICIGSLKSSDD